MFSDSSVPGPTDDDGELRNSMASLASMSSAPTNRSIISPNWTPRQSTQVSPPSAGGHSTSPAFHAQLEGGLVMELERRLHIAEERYRIEAAEHLHSLEVARGLLDEERARRRDLEQRLQELEERYLRDSRSSDEGSVAEDEPPLNAVYQNGAGNKTMTGAVSIIGRESSTLALEASGKKKVGIRSILPNILTSDRRPNISKPWAPHHLVHFELDTKTGELTKHPPRWQALLEDEQQISANESMQWNDTSHTSHAQSLRNSETEMQYNADDNRNTSPPPVYTGIAH